MTGWAGKWNLDEREPARMRAEKRADQIKVLPADEAQKMVDISNAKTQIAIACWEWSPTNASLAQNLEVALKTLSLGERLQKTEVTEVANNMVYIAPSANLDAAEKKLAQLKKLGLTDLYVVQDQSALRWAISLGVFKTPEAAKAFLATMQKRNIKDLKMATRSVNANKVVFRFLNLQVEEKKALDQVLTQFPELSAQVCQSDVNASKVANPG